MKDDDYLDANRNNPEAIGGLLDLSEPTGREWFFADIVDAIRCEHVTKQATTGDYLPEHDPDECGICEVLLRARLVA